MSQLVGAPSTASAKERGKRMLACCNDLTRDLLTVAGLACFSAVSRFLACLCVTMLTHIIIIIFPKQVEYSCEVGNFARIVLQ